MKRKAAHQKNLNNFLEGVLSAKILSKQLAQVIPIDTTSVPTLKVIQDETAKSKSIDDKILFQTSSKLIGVFARVQRDYQKLKRPNFKEEMEECYSSFKNKKQTIEKKINMKLVERKDRNQKSSYLANFLIEGQNNQNENTLNLQVDNKCNDKIAKAPKKINIDCKLVQIVRPQYKKSQQDIKRTDRQVNADLQMTPIQIRTNRTYVTESSDSQDIPIVRNSINSHREANQKLKRKSVSPKHENRNLHQLNNISAISRNYQTQTDHSFQIDLYGMGFVAERPKADHKPLHHVYLIKGEASVKDRASKLEIINTGIKVQSQKIQEQEPWQCDEEEIQEQIRQINQRLRQKTYYTQRNKTESDEWKSKRKY